MTERITDLLRELDDCLGWADGLAVEMSNALAWRIHNALERQAKLERALQAIVKSPSSVTIAYGDVTGPTSPPHAYIVTADLMRKAQALIAEPAAGPAGSRGE